MNPAEDPPERLSDPELERYSRQLLLPEWGEPEQLRLRSARVAVVGCGGLGGPAALHLAGAGVGRLRLLDPDRVELDNLSRQVAFSSSQVGGLKAELLAAAVTGLNPLVTVEPVAEEVGEGSADRLLGGSDLVLECSDDPPTKFLVNDWCCRRRLPLVLGGAIGFRGQLLAVGAGDPCYRCLFRQPPEGPGQNCREAGVMGPLVGVVGAMQALLAVELLAGLAGPGGRLLDLDGLSGRWRKLSFARDPGCGCHPGAVNSGRP